MLKEKETFVFCIKLLYCRKTRMSGCVFILKRSQQGKHNLVLYHKVI